jgi:hypothetical protein
MCHSSRLELHAAAPDIQEQPLQAAQQSAIDHAPHTRARASQGTAYTPASLFIPCACKATTSQGVATTAHCIIHQAHASKPKDMAGLTAAQSQCNSTPILSRAYVLDLGLGQHVATLANTACQIIT